MTYRLHGYSNQDFEVRFSPPPALGNFISTIIGPNGSGKSRLLTDIAVTMRSSLKDPGYASSEHPERVLVISNMVYDKFPLSDTKVPQYVYLGVRQGTNMVTSGVWADQIAETVAWSWFLPERQRMFAPALDIVGVNFAQPPQFGIREVGLRRWRERRDRVADISRGYNSRSRIILDSRHGSAIDELIELLPSIRRLEKSGPSGDRTDHCARIEDVARRNDLHPSQLLEAAFDVKIILPYIHLIKEGRYVRAIDLSAGEQLILSNLARLARYVVPNSLVLFDEPEIGLHPEWQSRMIPEMNRMIPDEFGCHFIVTTHSPHVVVEGAELLVPGSRRGHFVPYEGDYAGRSIESLLYRAFESRTSRNRDVEKDLTLLIRAISAGRPKPGMGDEFVAAFERLKRVAGDDTPEVSHILSQASVMLGRS
ncbi:ATP-binding protein [Arthrobacter sp. YN]|uniref:ATP-binding protein n=1 Tax=Arthrobacter sp. YN TaxID=2020486 RepID=UPI000B5E18D5|nr:ATP-binding protein [Arthrobacter sp. YN]ASN19308.1 hypothetical protein CGK93_06090 [Arthrobacter sp. YN]